MTDELDAGPVLVQRSFPVLANDDRRDLWARCARAGVDALAEMLTLVEDRAAGTAQPDARAERRPTPAELAIDWALPATQLHDRIRAQSPQPGAKAVLDGEETRLVFSAIESGSTTTTSPGMVLGQHGRYRRVTTGRGTLVVAVARRRFLDALA